jgi:hypothetical protein
MLGGTVGDMSLPLHEIAQANHDILDPFTDEEHYRPRFRGTQTKARLIGCMR